MSTVAAGDLILVNRGGVDYHAPADMSTIADADLLLVNRAGVDYRCSYANKASIQDTDILLVHRAGVDYSCTYANFKSGLKSVTKPKLLTPAPGATDVGDSLTLTSSAFAASAGVTHASSDWQVALATDTAFASPVVQSMADATDLVAWIAGSLQPSTSYIARVRHNGTGAKSAWSDVVAFQTAASLAEMADPGDVYYTTDGAQFVVHLAPAKIANLSSSATLVRAVGVDGLVYSAPLTGKSINFALIAAAPTDVVQVACMSNASGPATTNGTAFLKKDGTLIVYDATGVNVSPSASRKFIRIGSFGAHTDAFWAEGTDGTIHALGVNGQSLGSVTANRSFQPLGLALPGGRKIRMVTGAGGGPPFAGGSVALDVRNILVLADDGTLWCVCTNVSNLPPGLPSTGLTNATPAQVSPGTVFTSIATAGGGHAGVQASAVSAVDSTGQLWYAATAGCSNTGSARTWGKVPYGHKWIEPVFGSAMAGSPLGGLAEDGYIVVSGTNGNLLFAHPGKQVRPSHKLGNLVRAQNLAGNVFPFIFP